MKQKPTDWGALVGIVLALAIIGTPIFFLTRGCTHEHSVRKAALSVIPKCKTMGERDITVFGKVMLFDDRSTDQDQFPFFTSRSRAILGDLVASPQGRDRDITVFIISTRRLAMVGNYEPRGGRAYNAQFDIGVVQLPKAEPLGMHTILSTPPPKVLSRIGGTPGEVIGNIDDVLQWIKNLPQKK